MNRIKLGVKDALIIVDVQNDFCFGGKLPIKDADKVIPVLNQWAKRAEQAGAVIIASRDWHPEDHVSFQSQGGPWPEHCVRQTSGAEFHPKLKIPSKTFVVSKGMSKNIDNYSAFDHTDLADRLQSAGVKNIWIGGLAEDVCVKATVLDGLSYGFQVFVLKDGTKPVNQDQSEEVFRDLEHHGAILVGGV
jgi:nicotinamidase/pyrazinamidase